MTNFLLLITTLAFATEIAKVESLWVFSPSGEPTERIIGGTRASEGQFKYAVALYTNNRFMCTASVIGPRTILTAAHCVVGRNGQPVPASSLSGNFGTVHRERGRRIQFIENIPHPQYNPRNVSNDVALLKTAEDVTADSRVEKLCIADSSTPIDHYNKTTAMGWGQTVPYFPLFLPRNLKHVGMKLNPHRYCVMRYPRMVTEQNLCADGYGRGVCNGDSGGPLVHIGPGNLHTEVGIASWVRIVPGCSSIGDSPPVFARVAYFANWIIQAAKEDGVNICRTTVTTTG